MIFHTEPAAVLIASSELASVQVKALTDLADQATGACDHCSDLTRGSELQSKQGCKYFQCPF